MKGYRVSIAFGVMLVLVPTGFARAQDASAEAQRILDRAGMDRGICLLLSEDPGPLAIALARASDLSICIQVPISEQADDVREMADREGLLGRRIFVQRGTWSRLHLADNVADVVVVPQAEDSRVRMSMPEVLRVLRPGGMVLVGAEQVVKPFPEGVGDWSHPYHGPDNNPQSRDTLARAPYLTQFLAEPWYSPMPLVTVASGGRLFKAFGHIAIKQREWPMLNTLVAQNAFNGTILWKRELSPDFMIHRSTMIATPDTLYLADDESCKLLDASTGRVRDQIVAASEDGPVWKWLALTDGVLYALVGSDETPDPTLRGDRRARGWPWGPPLGAGYNSKTYPWGFGQTILAIDPASKKILWRHRETDSIDTRAMCMAAGRIFFYSHGKFLGALNADDGTVLWRTSDPDVLQAIGEHRFAQNPGEGFSSSSYAKCDDRGIYFAGPSRTDMAAVSARDGRLLWRIAGAGNSQLVLRADGLIAMGPRGSAKHDYASGEVIEVLGPRVNCTRATGSVDSIFVRGGRDGTMRYDLLCGTRQHISPMRPSCQDGVLVAHGHLYWGPWMCDCNLTLVGVVAAAPAGDFDFAGTVQDDERLERAAEVDPVVPFEVDAADWPTLRANNACTAVSPVDVAGDVRLHWTWQSPTRLPATAPTAAGGAVFVAGQDGAIRALDAATGRLKWTAYTGGAILYPPTLWQSRALVGSSDGWLYCFEAATGRRLWQFRAAPVERLIPVYGSIRSTWPVASGVLVDDGVAYAAAGMANYDGTHVFALDAATGKVRWHNHASGALHPETSSGASVNGHLLLHGGHLHLAGGNMIPVASYNVADGTCVTDPSAPDSHTQYTAGSDLFAVGPHVRSGGPPLYAARGDYRMVNHAVLQAPGGDVVFAYGPHDGRVALFEPGTSLRAGARPRWGQQPLNRVHGVAVTPQTVVVAGLSDSEQPTGEPEPWLIALRVSDGTSVWRRTLPAPSVPWGVLVDRGGRVIVSLQDGQIACFGPVSE